MAIMPLMVPVSYPKRRPPVATKNPTMIACAEEPAILSGLRQPMAKAAMAKEATKEATREGRWERLTS